MVQDVMRVWGESTSNPLNRLQVLGIVLIHAEELSCGASCLTYSSAHSIRAFPYSPAVRQQRSTHRREHRLSTGRFL